MAIDDSFIGKGLNKLFPSKRYAPYRADDVGCPTPPPFEDDEDEGGEQS
jgi:hypothetical protein